jgi:glycosyltransferase involved in cell wall biosynthesis
LDNTPQIQERFQQLKCCVIIPTYNNERTLAEVIRSVLAYTSNVIVVNDGATDTTSDILQSFDDSIKVYTHEVNKGKGWALRNGFKFAHDLGFEYAITIDSDGQHLAEDLILFIEKIEEIPGALIVGARNMNQSHIPGKSSFGNKFSNFWFRLETGINLPDTQSGFRLYPLEKMLKMTFFSTKYEFEIENIVKAAWKNIPVVSVPVSVIYQQGDERVTHFRPFKDFVRASILNTYLFTFALLWYIPMRLFLSLKKKNIKQLLKNELLATSETNFVKSISIAFGFFMGIFPIWGFQLALAIAGAYYFKFNKFLVILTAQISVPPMIPVIIYASYLVGGVFYDNPYELDFSNDITLDFIHNNFMQYFVGAVVLSIFIALITGFISYILLTFFRGKQVNG